MPTQVRVIRINYGGASAVPPPHDITMHGEGGGDLHSQPPPPGPLHHSTPSSGRTIITVTRINYRGRCSAASTTPAAVPPPENLAPMHEEAAGGLPHSQPLPPGPFHLPPDFDGWRRVVLRRAVPSSQGGGSRVRTVRSSAGEYMRTTALPRPSAGPSTGGEGTTAAPPQEGGGFRMNLGPWSHRRSFIDEYATAAAPLRLFAAQSRDEYTVAAAPPNEGLTKEEVSRFLPTTICEGSNGRDDRCVICHGDLYRNDDRKLIGILCCTHRFHADCIGKWLQRKNACPLCKNIGIQF